MMNLVKRAVLLTKQIGVGFEDRSGGIHALNDHDLSFAPAGRHLALGQTRPRGAETPPADAATPPSETTSRTGEPLRADGEDRKVVHDLGKNARR